MWAKNYLPPFPSLTLSHSLLPSLYLYFSISLLFLISETLRKNILEMAASLLACGLDPEKCLLFQQSRVPQHSELAWILGCNCTVPTLSRLSQYKEKSEKLKVNYLSIILSLSVSHSLYLSLSLSPLSLFNVSWTNVSWTNIRWTNVNWTNVCWTNVS